MAQIEQTRLRKCEIDLLKACDHGDIAKVEKALRAGARCRAPVFALQHAALSGRLPIIELLIAAGADADCAGNNIRSPLAAAADEGEDKIVELLLRLGATVDSRGFEGDTPLTLAASGETMKAARCVSLLLSAGADPLIKNDKGQTALDVAEQFGDECARALIAPHVAAALEKASLSKALASHGAPTTLSAHRPRL